MHHLAGNGLDSEKTVCQGRGGDCGSRRLAVRRRGISEKFPTNSADAVGIHSGRVSHYKPAAHVG